MCAAAIVVLDVNLRDRQFLLLGRRARLGWWSRASPPSAGDGGDSGDPEKHEAMPTGHQQFRDATRDSRPQLSPPHIPSYPPRTVHCSSTTRYSGEGHSRCPRPIPRPCNNSTASTGPHPGSTINSTTYFMGRSIRNACRTFNLAIWIWCGLSTIWTRYVTASRFPLSAQISIGFRWSRSFQSRLSQMSTRTQKHMRQQSVTTNVVHAFL
jgi:hypothetical protein